MDSRYIRRASQDTDASGSEVSPEWGSVVGQLVWLELEMGNDSSAKRRYNIEWVVWQS